jgi:uncharacterized membrane protein
VSDREFTSFIVISFLLVAFASFLLGSVSGSAKGYSQGKAEVLQEMMEGNITIHAKIIDIDDEERELWRQEIRQEVNKAMEASNDE